jgi:hypothetical protein
MRAAERLRLHEVATRGLKLFSKDVLLPRLREL